MNMPDLGGGLHFASVDYACTFFQISAYGGFLTFGVPSPVQFTFTFETGRTQPDPQADLYDVTWDYSPFDQAAEEQGIAVTLDTICAALSERLSVSRQVVEQSVQVNRVWTVAANQQGSAAPLQVGQFTITEAMPYPIQASGQDAVLASDGGESVAQI